MGIIDAISAAGVRKKFESLSEREWARLSDEEQSTVRSALKSGAIGTGKMHDVIAAEGYAVSKHFLDKVKAGEA